MDNSFKSQLQQREFEKLKDSQRVILKWATGCGKSKMAIDLVNHACSQCGSRHYKKTVLFLVAERAHIKNWQQEFDKWGLNKEAMELDIMCYASLNKVKDKGYDIIVMDEAHHAFTEKRMAILETVYAHRIFMLSATLSANKELLAETAFGKFTTSTVTLKDAIKDDILPDPKVYVIEMTLDDKKPNQEIRIGNDPKAPVVPWEKRAKYIYSKKPCIIRCTEQQKYSYMTTTMDYWKERYEHSKNYFHKNLWVNMGSQRKRFLGELKTAAVKKLIDKFPKSKRFICFCASLNQADMLGSDHTISSKKTDKSNQRIIDRFNAKIINSLYAVGMANEGMNLTDIQAGIIVQLDGKERLFIQKFGRSLRAEDPVTYIFYYKDTQDENYLRGALENIDNKFVKYMKL